MEGHLVLPIGTVGGEGRVGQLDQPGELHVFARGAGPAEREERINEGDPVLCADLFGWDVGCEVTTVFQLDRQPLKRLRDVLLAQKDPRARVPESPPDDCACHFLVAWLKGRRVSCLVAHQVHRACVSDDPALVSHGAVGVHLWDPRHGNRDDPLEELVPFIEAKEGPSFLGVLPQLGHCLSHVVPEAGVWGTPHSLGGPGQATFASTP